MRTPTMLTEYGCCYCDGRLPRVGVRHDGIGRQWHRLGIDPEYVPHLGWQSKHGVRRRPAEANEVLMLEMGSRPDAWTPPITTEV